MLRNGAFRAKTKQQTEEIFITGNEMFSVSEMRMLFVFLIRIKTTAVLSLITLHMILKRENNNNYGCSVCVTYYSDKHSTDLYIYSLYKTSLLKKNSFLSQLQ